MLAPLCVACCITGPGMDVVLECIASGLCCAASDRPLLNLLPMRFARMGVYLNQAATL